MGRASRLDVGVTRREVGSCNDDEDEDNNNNNNNNDEVDAGPSSGKRRWRRHSSRLRQPPVAPLPSAPAAAAPRRRDPKTMSSSLSPASAIPQHRTTIGLLVNGVGGGGGGVGGVFVPETRRRAAARHHQQQQQSASLIGPCAATALDEDDELSSPASAAYEPAVHHLQQDDLFDEPEDEQHLVGLGEPTCVSLVSTHSAGAIVLYLPARYKGRPFCVERCLTAWATRAQSTYMRAACASVFSCRVPPRPCLRALDLLINSIRRAFVYKHEMRAWCIGNIRDRKRENGADGLRSETEME